MYGYLIMNKTTGEKDIIFGRTWAHAVRRSGINPEEWTCLRQDYDELEENFD